jgi:hypothetical protein
MQLESRVEYFYAIPSTPRKAVLQRDLRKLRYCMIFIQSTSQGSRYLKKGEKRILYLKEVRQSIRSAWGMHGAMNSMHVTQPGR